MSEMRMRFPTSCLLAPCAPTSTARFPWLPTSGVSEAHQCVSDALCAGATGRWGNASRREITADWALAGFWGRAGPDAFPSTDLQRQWSPDQEGPIQEAPGVEALLLEKHVGAGD